MVITQDSPVSQGPFNVIEVTGGPKAGRIAIVPARKAGFKNPLRNARYRLCNVGFTFADGFACGLITAGRER
jgi:hypothetical protein